MMERKTRRPPMPRDEKHEVFGSRARRGEAIGSDTVDELFADFLSHRDVDATFDFETWVAAHPAHRETLEELYAGWTGFDARLDDLVAATPDLDAKAQDPVTATLHPGMRIGDFELVCRIGSGGMGQVWEAEQFSLGRRVALKFIHPEKVNPSRVHFFLREARAGGRINHPGIVPVYGHGEVDGVHWIAMELVAGRRTLGGILESARRLPVLDRSYFLQTAERFVLIAEAMHAAHAGGIVHRDLKPSNILITPSGIPRVTDFGLAFIEGESVTRGSALGVGSVHYMSPEQAAPQGEKLDRRTDVFSLGAVLYEALTLRRAFEGDHVPEILDRIAHEDPPGPCEVSHGVPRDLALICMRALEKRPRDRFQSMEEMARALRLYLRDEPLPFGAPGPLRRLGKWVRRHPTASTAGALGWLSLVVVLWLLADTMTAKRDAEESARVAMAAKQDAEEAAREMAELVRQLRAAQLMKEGTWLGPLHPDNMERYEHWIASVRPVAERRSEFERELEVLRSHGHPRHAIDEDPSLPVLRLERAAQEAALARMEEIRTHERTGPIISARPRDLAILDEVARRARGEVEILSEQLELGRLWQLDDPGEQARHDHLAMLLGQLARYTHPEVGDLAFMESRLAAAGSLRESTLEAHVAEWEETIRAAHDVHGVELRPQLGLVPLGGDPGTKLLEFWHVLSGERPERSVDGQLVMTAETGLVFILIPGGTTTLGAQADSLDDPNYDPNAVRETDKSPELVTVPPYFISKYEMTQGQWIRATGRNPSVNAVGNWGGDGRLIDGHHPVEAVTWLECESVLSLWGLVFPTEDQWEFAARAGTDTVYWIGDDFMDLAHVSNFADITLYKYNPSAALEREVPPDGYLNHAPVDAFEPNGFGLYCISGNVVEWCRDSNGPDDPWRKVVRGGSFADGRQNLRIAWRKFWLADTQWGDRGVRPARQLDP